MIDHRSLKVGDIFRWPSGRLRVARLVHLGNSPRKSWVFFSIQHCSWTGRCYTLYSVGELMSMGVTKTQARIKRFGQRDQEINNDIEQRHDRERFRFRCCDVVGIYS